MADETKQTPRRPAMGSQDALRLGYGPLFDGGQQAFSRWLEGIFAFSQEIARFTQDRLQEDVAAWQSFAAARTPEDAIECQRHFAAKAAEQYGEEMNKLWQMVMRMMGAAASPPRPEA